MNPVIALVGRPNVGKSTLFNCLTKTRDALVADYPGLTRDRKYGHAVVDETEYTVIDTGGLSGETEGVDVKMAAQTLLAIEESSLILFLVDARDGMTTADQNIAEQLRRYGKKIFLVVNKIDGFDVDAVMADFYTLGFQDLYGISSANNRGVPSMMVSIFSQFEFETSRLTELDDGIRVALVGRPNVGKSTLINRILGEDRVVAFDEPGTTRDSILVPFERDDKKYVLIDTAGVRRKKNISLAVEKFSVIKSLQAIDYANVVVLVIDAHEGLADQDLSLLSYVIDAGRALVIAVNKWDGMEEYDKDRIKIDLERKLGFANFADIYFISALHGSNVGLLYKAINDAYDSAFIDLTTPELTRLLEKAIEVNQPPIVKSRRLKMRYAHQGGKNPPIVIIHGPDPELVPDTYKRYLINFFRKVLKIKGTPIRMEFKAGANPYSGRRNVLNKRQQAKKNRMISYIKKNDKKRKNKSKNKTGGSW
ncbi:MAG: ribosome biogenesis GTPase Der [Gammaproteobacteria bacterium]|nr:ribosome biogenesis GTPase Der [Gammaproteobacteria bacterium]